MNINVLETVYKMVRTTSITDLEVKRGETFINMKFDASNPAPVQEEAPAVEPIADAEPTLETIKSDTVGFFYDRKKNAPDPIVKVGDTIKKGQIVGFISSMGTMMSVKSAVSGKIVSKKCENKEPVEYGEIIFEVEGA